MTFTTFIRLGASRAARRFAAGLFASCAMACAGAAPNGAQTASAPAAMPAARGAALPANSVYHLAVKLTDQDGRSFRMDERRGKPVQVSMVYMSQDGRRSWGMPIRNS